MSSDEPEHWFTAALVQDVLTRHFRRCELIHLVGGIALKDVVDGTAIVPSGWVMDVETCYFVPPDFDPSDKIH